MFLVYKTSPTEFIWTASAPVDMIEAAGVSVKHDALQLSVMDEYTDTNALGRCRRVMTGVGTSFPPAVLQTLDATDVASVTEHGQYTHTPDTLPVVCGGGVPHAVGCCPYILVADNANTVHGGWARGGGRGRRPFAAAHWAGLQPGV